MTRQTARRVVLCSNILYLAYLAFLGLAVIYDERGERKNHESQ